MSHRIESVMSAGATTIDLKGRKKLAQSKERNDAVLGDDSPNTSSPLSVVEESESVVRANLQRATRLRHSILQKAFVGAL
jgi:hypothetical protein